MLSPGETASADISFGVVGTPSNSVLASYLAVTPPNCYNHFTSKIPDGPALVWLHQVSVTPMAYHTPYIPNGNPRAQCPPPRQPGRRARVRARVRASAGCGGGW